MNPGIYNIEIRKNSKFLLPLNWKDESGSAVVLNGYTARMVVGYKEENADTVLLDLSTANGMIVLGGNPENILISINVQNIPIGIYDYDLQLTSGSGQDYSLLTGRFVIVKNKAGIL